MDFESLWKNHKTVVIVVGVATLGAIVYTYLHRSSSSGATTTANSPSGLTTANSPSGLTTAGGSLQYTPTQYLVPYNAFFQGGGTPDSGSTGSSTQTTTTNTNTSQVPNNYQLIQSPAAGSALAAAGYNQYELVPGTNTYVQVVGNNQWLPTASKFSQGESGLYYMPSQQVSGAQTVG